MISYNLILLFAICSVCVGKGRRTTTMFNNGKNYTHANQELTWMRAKTVYAFTAKDIKGNNIPMSIYRGKLLLIVNVASKCGLTIKNYKMLVSLHKKYADKGLVILAFPCNQFLNQEPGTNEEIAKFAMEKGVKFPMFSKVNVNGDDASPLWKFLKSKTKRKGDIVFSFTKFIVDRNGKLLKKISPLGPTKTEAYLSNYFKF